MVQCARHRMQYSMQAHAYGFAGQMERPLKHIIPTQAPMVLGEHGGIGHSRVDKFRLDGVASFDSAYSEVGGGYDECHDRYTSFASAVIENLNVHDVVTADRIVSRIAVYSPTVGDNDGEISFTIAGSHFDNLRIAGHRFDVKLATNVFHQHDTHSKIASAHRANKLDEWLLGNKLARLSDRELQEVENTYHALGGMSEVLKGWKLKGDKRRDDVIAFSPLNHIKVEDHAGANTELFGFGSIICIPKFGVVRLAELTVRKHYRTLQMLRVDMCSTGTGGSTGPSSGGGGTKPGGS